MKNPAGESNFLLRLQISVFFLLTAVLPLFITKLTFSRSDLPKSTVLMILGGIYILLTFLIIIKNVHKLNIKLVSLIDIPVTLYFLSVIISFIFSLNKYNSFYGAYERHIGLVTYSFIFLIYFCNAVFNGNENFVQRLCFTMELTAVIVAVYALIQQIGTDPFSIQPANDTRPVSTIGNAVFAGGFLAIVLPVSVFNIAEKKNIILRYMFSGLIIAGILVTRTRSAYTAIIAETAAGLLISMLIFKNSGRNKYLYFLITITVLSIIFIYIFPHNMFSERILSLFAPNNNPRWLIWRDALGIIYKYPLTGTGLGNFPIAFSEFYSYELRYFDVIRYIDNAHNNYIQILCTMGLIGITGFFSIFTGAFVLCIKKIRSTLSEKKIKLFYTAILLSLTGYFFYGLTNFDDITILFYINVILILLRSMIKGKSIVIKPDFKKNLTATVIFIPILTFSLYYSYVSALHLSSDMNFLKGMEYFNNNNFKEGISLVNKAINDWHQNPVYRYSIAMEVYKFVRRNPVLDDKTRVNLLSQAANEVIKAKNNHTNHNECDALLSLIYFEEGRLDDAEKLKYELLRNDKVNISYRINIAYYYVGTMQLPKAAEQIEAIDKMGFQSANFWFLKAYYFYTVKDNDKSLKFIAKVLQSEPGNTDALKLKKIIEISLIKK
ncbi:MAG: O-antigen ligase family protein [Ignavibacteria bacterium]|nr:O-antigen ligase family protein [Ignavibacteria bacterium]